MLSLVTLVLFLPVFVPNVHLLNEPMIVRWWLVIAAVNPWLKEGFWRGLLVEPDGAGSLW